jgi:hypothetical protein
MCDDARRGCFAVSAAGLRAYCCGHGRLCRCRGHPRHGDVNAEPTTQPRADGLGIPFLQAVAIESKALGRLERAVWVQPRAVADELPVAKDPSRLKSPNADACVAIRGHPGSVEFTRTPTFALP